MALINCPNCGHKISDQAIRCPKCGQSMSVRDTPPSFNPKPVHVSNSDKKKAAKKQQTPQIPAKSNTKSNRKKIGLIIGILVAVVVLGILGQWFIGRYHNAKLQAEQIALEEEQAKAQKLAMEKAFEDSIAIMNYQTPDLKMLGLHGPVKSVVYDNESDPILNVQYVLFDTTGLIVQVRRFGQIIPEGDALLIRGSNNLIKKWSYYPESFMRENDVRCERVFSYDNDGFVNKISISGWENSNNTTTTWNKDGQLIKQCTYGNGEGTDYKIFTSYEIIATDKYGNWIEMEASDSYSDDQQESSYEKTTEKITRTIIYYND